MILLAVLAPIVLFYVCRFTYRLVRALLAGRKLDKPSLVQLRAFGLFCGAVAIIVAAEYFVPSSAMTGLQRPIAQDPPRRAAKQAWVGGMTYDEMSKLSPSLAHLGYVTRDEVVARLRGELEKEQSRLKIDEARSIPKSSILPSNISYLSRILFETIRNRKVRISALNNAIGNVDTLFANGKVTYFQSVAFEFEYKTAAAKAAYTAAQDEMARASNALAKHITERGEDTPSEPSEAEKKLRKAVTAELQKSRSVLRFQRATTTAAYENSLIADAVDPAAQFPDLKRPLVVWETSGRVRPPMFAQTGPAAKLSHMVVLKKITDAAAGYERAPRWVNEEQRCYFVIAQGTEQPIARRLCEISTILPINYDVTASRCATDAAAFGSPYQVVKGVKVLDGALCKERWVFPSLNIVYALGQFTISEPRPSDVSDADWATFGAPISAWTVAYHGQEKPLKGTATFEWDGASDVLENLELVHRPQPQVSSPRVWSDFERDTAGISVANAIDGSNMSHSHNFTSFVIEDTDLKRQSEKVSAFWLEHGGWLNQRRLGRWNSMRKDIRARQQRLGQELRLEAQKADRTPSMLALGCAADQLRNPLSDIYENSGFYENILQKIDFKETFDEERQFTCENFQAINALLEGFWIEFRSRPD